MSDPSPPRMTPPPENGAQSAPAPPRTLAEVGLNPVLMSDLLLKTAFRTNAETASALSRLICLPLVLTQDLIDLLRARGLLEASGTLHAHSGPEMPYRLTESGKARALDALALSEYFGPMPVPLAAYRVQLARQSIRDNRIDRGALQRAMGHLVLPPALLDQLGPAVSSGRSVLMYGPPGNGKSAISNGIRDAISTHIHIPRALEYAGQVITVFDPTVHAPVADPQADRGAEPGAEPGALRRNIARFDPRYILCRRPAVVTGGELSLDMLDLSYNPTARVYTAPLQLKAAGGVFIVDDLGRQAEPPQKIINRWIVPLEEGRDILSLQSGEKFEVPFDTLVIFSTNFHPNQIFDRAALRRIFFKIRIDGPSAADYLKIFAIVARQRGFGLDEAAMLHLLKVKYPSIGNVFANYQPVFLIDQMIAICDFERRPRQMDTDLLERAWQNLFVAEGAEIAP